LLAEIRAQTPALNVEILGVNDLNESAFNYLMTGGRQLPWLQDTAEQNVWSRWKVIFRDVRILDAQNRLYAVFNLTQFDLTYPTNRQALKTNFLNAPDSLTPTEMDCLMTGSRCTSATYPPAPRTTVTATESPI
jgi:hypothetical protein